MRRFFLFSMISALGMAPALANETDCAEAEDITTKIAACTAIIEAGEITGPNLAWVYSNRGLGYRRAGDLDQAMQDYNEAIRLRSDYADAYGNRAYAQDLLGKPEEAIADWETALRLGGKDRVRRAQTYLKGKGHYKGAIDGAYGPKSRAALRACVYDVEC